MTQAAAAQADSPSGGAPADARVRTARTADGHLDVQCQASGGSWVRIHSQYGPESEARTLVDRALDGAPVPPVVALIGIGLGYVIDVLQQRRPDVRIVALELIPDLLASFHQRRDWAEAIESRRLLIASAPYELPMPGWPAEALAENPIAIVHPVIARLAPSAVEPARRALAQFVFEQRANAEARQRLAALYLRHTLDNLPALTAAADVRALDGIAAGAPIVMCGAGPSLNRMAASIRKYRDRAWVVALDTALHPLLQSGVFPDLVVAVDPTPTNGRHLINLPGRTVPWLVAETSIDPRAMIRFMGRTFACRIGRADPWPWLEQIGIDPPRIRVWGSVLTAGCDLVSRMQGGPIVFAGMDLAFTNGQPYCRGTAFESDWAGQQIRDQLPSIESVWRTRIADAIEETDLDGRPTLTTPQMVAFRNWVRTAAAAAAPGTFVNATGAGILHGPGITHAHLDEVFGGRAAIEPPHGKLAAAARSGSIAGAAALIEAIDAALAPEPEAAANPWPAWAESVPDFDAAATRQQLQHLSARLAARQGVTMMEARDEWIDVPYDRSIFSGHAPLHWNVGEANVVTYAYRLQGKTMTLAFKVVNSALEGIPANELYLRIPDHYLPQRSIANAIWLGGLAGKECGYATVHPGFDRVVMFRGNEERFPVDPGGFCLFGQLTFEVQ